MRVDYWKYKTDENGNVEGGGNVITTHDVLVSRDNYSDGYWIRLCAGRGDDGIVRGMTTYFDSEHELDAYLADDVRNGFLT